MVKVRQELDKSANAVSVLRPNEQPGLHGDTASVGAQHGTAAGVQAVLGPAASVGSRDQHRVLGRDPVDQAGGVGLLAVENDPDGGPGALPEGGLAVR